MQLITRKSFCSKAIVTLLLMAVSTMLYAVKPDKPGIPGSKDASCTISTVPESAVINAGENIVFTGSVSGKPPATYDWVYDGGNPAIANTESVTVIYATEGSYIATLNGANGKGESCRATTTITVNAIPAANIAPVLESIGDKSVTLNNDLVFTVTATDDGQANGILTLSAENLPTGATFTDNGDGTGNFDWVNASPVSSTLTAFTVSDGALNDTEIINITVNDTQPAPNVSINSTSQNTTDVGVAPNGDPVPEQPFLGNDSHRVMAINDLGMHCGDFDTRIASILPPFQVLLAQVIEKGVEPRLLDNTQAEVVYSAVSNPDDPVLNNPNVFTGVALNGSVFKTNFWNTVASGAYDPFYPPQVTPLAGAVTDDIGLPVPNVEVLYIGPDGVPGTADDATGKDDSLPLVDRGTLIATQHAMPGMTAPYLGNEPHVAEEYYNDKPFFLNFPFGYVAEELSWFEGAGIPFSAFDDFGRENPYPLVRVQANVDGTTVATTDTVLPISGEASCKNCHSADVTDTPHAGSALGTLGDNVASMIDDPAMGELPMNVSIEYATDINILKLHDQEHGTTLVTGTTADFPTPGTADFEPVVCQVCHYTPALDLAHVGPLGADHLDANGRTQLSQSTMSNVMHSHHGSTGLFPDIPAPIQNTDGFVINQPARVAAMEASCYQCHPGTDTQCLRGAMSNGDMLCSDCHGSMSQVGDDFSKDVSPTNSGLDKFILTGNFYDPDDLQPRVPWANEPGCGSCHTGDVTNNQAGDSGTVVNTKDVGGNVDGIRLRQAFLTGDAKATPIVPNNNRFAENIVPDEFNGTPNPGAGNPQLYRVSTGHGGVMCEGCHGATHAEWPNANPSANDNVAANQLQGHTGTIVECDTCHLPSAFEDSGELQLTMDGPHGMHAVGSTHWNTHHKEARQNGGDNCRTCHGADGEGTVLSRMSKNRTLQCKDDKGDFCTAEGPELFEKGHVVGCNDCHANHL